MKITLEMLKEKGAVCEGLKEFKKRYGIEADYQEMLDVLSTDESISNNNRLSWVRWLMQKFGSLNTVKKVEGDLKVKFCFFAGSIEVTGKIFIEAGGYIEAGRYIKAGEFIKAGRYIEAGESIEAGGDYGIYVGLSIRISLKPEKAIVKSKEEPKNLLLGRWIKI